MQTRRLRTSAQSNQPRISLHEYQQNKRRQQPKEARFGTFRRMVPDTLVGSKPQPHEPSLESVPRGIDRPLYARSGTPPGNWGQHQIPRLTAGEISQMRIACEIARDALALGGRMVQPGATTGEIDRAVHSYIVSRSAYPSCLNYMGFPKSICTSVNNVIAHGIPDQRKLEDGDIVNLDVTVYKDGFHGDTSAMFAAGIVDKPGRDLIDTTREALELAIQACGPQVPFRMIGETIEAFVVPLGYSVSQELTGHGVGREFHQNPLIYHHYNEEPGAMAPGMAFTIEPIVSQGTSKGVLWPDGWTITTMDGGRSAQFEHTIVVTESGVEILTA
ncbi:hypothetical protein IW140_000394 [Coemansia sp. RSA 1813]|nr:hypothetical protein EV178_000647 [Coemansia sp. RSA 1646]KAJ1773267.1 hypothetical protein LPJ74_000777 [Coemansia sp. RSA 1843]KAJ2092734.1 hypothetical protein IW138_000828 [Coemansia sp. RSA 986]KAJ2217767.1 hypothetical protein EV179_000253 [Coemansia sp. RSA 487]KAJ2572996.1 hypothetical protein IW140_000394 [Coemansia sp. RSA 1813]